MVARAKAPKPETSDDVITIDDIGPIEHLEIPCQPGTVVKLTGPNGGGKTTALNAIDALTSGNGKKLENRDGTHKGEVSFAGVSIKVGRNGANRRLGDMKAVVTLEDDLNLDQLVDPGQKDPAAADIRRIKALAKVCGVNLPLTELQDLVGGAEAFAEIVDAKSLVTDDVVGCVEKIKRDIEGAARTVENQAVANYQASKNKLAENEGLDLEAPSDSDALQSTLETAIKTEAGLKSRQQQHAEQAERMHKAEAALAEAVRNYSGPSAEDAAKKLSGTNESLAAQKKLCEDLERQLLEASNQYKRFADQAKSDEAALSAAKSHEAALDGWQQTINAGGVAAPSAEELAAASNAVQAAREAANNGVLIRAGLKRVEEAKQLEDKAAEARKRAERLRGAAQATLDVLAAAVSKISEQMSIDSDFRLTVEHPKRGRTYFSDLSAGEKWKLVIDIAIEACQRKNERCVMVIRQEAWEGLDGRNQNMIIQHVAKTVATLYVGEASKDADPKGGVGVEVLKA